MRRLSCIIYATIFVLLFPFETGSSYVFQAGLQKCYITQVSLKLVNPSASASRVLGLQVCATKSSSKSVLLREKQREI
jgi:hypothetical protein